MGENMFDNYSEYSIIVCRTDGNICEDGFQSNLALGTDTHILIQCKWLLEAVDDVIMDDPDISWEKRTPPGDH